MGTDRGNVRIGSMELLVLLDAVEKFIMGQNFSV